MTYLYVFCGLCVVLSVVTVYLENKKIDAAKYVCKTMASLCFVFVAVLALSKADALGWRLYVLVALILGMLGDIFLSSGNVVDDEKKLEYLNLTGVVFFFAGHIVLIVWLLGFVSTFIYWFLILPVALPIIMFTLIKTGVFKLGNAIIPCMAYAAVIGLMLASALNVFINLKGETVAALIFAAAILFTESDSVLSVCTFSKGVKPWIKYTYMVPYYVAQLLFALSILY